MKTKLKKSKTTTHYFAETRDYSKIVEIEAIFFRELVRARTQFPSHASLQENIHKMSLFIDDFKGRELELTFGFDVSDPRKSTSHKLFLGTRLSPARPGSAAESTHFFCLADEDALLTKFHADRDFDEGRVEKKPSSHVQSGGRIPPALKGKYEKIWWDPDVNKPRMPALPTCTALLWHWAFLEYQDNELPSKFLNNRWWHKLIKDAEGAIFTPFFEDGARLMKQHPESGLINAFYCAVPK